MTSDIIREGKIYSAMKSGVMGNLFKIEGEEKEVLYQHPPSSIGYFLSVNGDHRCTFG